MTQEEFFRNLEKEMDSTRAAFASFATSMAGLKRELMAQGFTEGGAETICNEFASAILGRLPDDD